MRHQTPVFFFNFSYSRLQQTDSRKMWFRKDNSPTVSPWWAGGWVLKRNVWVRNLEEMCSMYWSIASEILTALFQITKLMHNYFIFQQYICYTTLLNMFRAARCSSSGGSVVSPQPLASSPSVSSRTVCGWRADSSPAYCTAVYRGWRCQRLWWYNWPSWGWAACWSKHVERSVTYTGCHRRNGPNFGRVFLMLNYTDITQNTYIQSW